MNERNISVPGGESSAETFQPQISPVSTDLILKHLKTIFGKQKAAAILVVILLLYSAAITYKCERQQHTAGFEPSGKKVYIRQRETHFRNSFSLPSDSQTSSASLSPSSNQKTEPTLYSTHLQGKSRSTCTRRPGLQ